MSCYDLSHNIASHSFRLCIVKIFREYMAIELITDKSLLVMQLLVMALLVMALLVMDLPRWEFFKSSH